MLFDLPDHDTLYEALLRRDAGWDGRAFVGVTSTGVFCRLTCPARKPNSQNCRFFDNVAACMDAGFRACKRCHPMTPQAQADPCVQTLLDLLETHPNRRWCEVDITAMGFDASTVRRAFKRHFGCTFLDLARRVRLRAGLETLSDGGRVIDAQIDAGFSSASAFREAFARLLGLPPGAFRSGARMQADWIETPLGPMIAISDATHLHLLEFVERKALRTELKNLHKMVRGDIGFGRPPPTQLAARELDAFFAGHNATFTVPLAFHGQPFTRTVWRALQDIPAGETRSYSQIARSVNRPDAVRAVAQANGANQIAVLIPCHRVIGADGALTGYGGGLWRKQKLIALETQYAQTTRRTSYDPD
jgi:AraC family transcriptional regulator of adaptative response/methylated-DNA-[protein]-cysteine methyltransferase